MSDGYIDDEVVNAYLSIVNRQQHISNSHCMPTSFFDFLYNPSGAIRYLEPERLHYDHAKRCTDNIDIFSLHNWTVPVFLGNRTSGHWSLLNANITTREVRYYDSLGCGGKKYADALCEFLNKEWSRKQPGASPIRKSYGTDDQSHIKEQQTTVRYTLYSLLWLLIIT